MSSRKRKRAVSRLFYGRFHSSRFFWRSAEECGWENVAPVGREFGSPDYARLMQQDHDRVKSNLSSLVEECSAVSANMDSPSEIDELDQVKNVQIALDGLGYRVSLPLAAGVWKQYSSSLNASWAPGAATVASARWHLVSYCTPTPSERDVL